MLVPAVNPVTSPVALTVATDGFEETHGLVTLAALDPVNWVVAPAQRVSVPVMKGIGYIVTVEVAIHPALFLKVIIVVPVEIAVNIPVLLIVATAGVEEIHGLEVAAVHDPVS